MADTRPVRTEADYEAALARIDELMDADPDSPDARDSGGRVAAPVGKTARRSPVIRACISNRTG